MFGNLNNRQDIHQGYTENFCYDGLNRLQQYGLNTACNGTGHVTIDYDGLGNMTRKSDVCNPGSQCMYYGESGFGPHQLDRIVGTYNGVTNPTFAYDANGNMTSGGGRSTSYTSFNMAATITEGSTSLGLAYGASHNRFKMCVPNCTSPTTTTYYVYDPATGGMSEKVVSGSSVTWKDYITAPGAGLVALRTDNGTAVTMRYIVTDHLGSVSSVTDTAGFPPSVERDSYDAWGKRRNSDGTANPACSITSQTTRGYTSQEMLDSVCLINMNARIYDPSLGRFESADSIVPNPGYSQSFNRFAYVVNNPLALIDPSGNTDICNIDPRECSFMMFIGGVNYSPAIPDACGNVPCPTGGGWLDVPFQLGCGAGCGGYGLGGGSSGNFAGGTAAGNAQERQIETVVVEANRKPNSPIMMPPSSVKQVACLGTALNKNKFALSLDAAGLIPGEGNAVTAGQLAASGAGAVYSAVTKDTEGAFLGLTSYNITAWAMAGAQSGAPRFLKIIPFVGSAVSVYELYHDFTGVDRDYQACMAS